MIEDGLSVSDVGAEYDPFAGPALDRIVPSTEAQREVWLASRHSREASLAYNESVTLRLAGRLDLAALQAAVDAVAARHESLRATFGPDGTTMCVASAQPIPITGSDLRGLEPAAQVLAVEGLLHDEVEHAFDLEHGPLLRVRRVVLAAELHLVVLTMHHIVCDGWSFGLIVRDLGRLYAQHVAASRGEAVASDVGVAASFADYALAHAAHEHSAAGRADADHWLQRFANVPAPLELPIDRPRRARRSFASKRTDVVLDAALVERLRRLAARDGASLYSMLLGGFAALLHRLGGGDNLVIGVPTAGQSEPGFGEVVGHCVNLLPLRVPVEPAQPVRDMARTAQAAMLDAFEHQRFTYGTLLKKLVLPRDPARLPLVSVMFNLDQAFDTDGSGFPGLSLDVKGNARTHENFELFVNAVQEGGALRLECQFNSDLFDEQSVRRWIGGYELLLRGACETPERPLGEIDVVVPADRALLAQWNATTRPFPHTLGVHDLIEAQVARTPERIALVSGAASLSYRELDERAALIAAALRTRGVGAGARVGLCAGRGAGMLASMLGVLKAGAAYVPLDPSYPADRIAHMVDDAGLALLISEPAYATLFNWPAASCLLLHDSGAPIEAVAPGALPAPQAAVPAESPAYVIYTSGSTGKPKGVVVPHRAVVNFLTSMARQPGLDGDDTLLAVTTLSFDIAVTELLLPLTVGARIVLATRDDAIDPLRLRELIETQRANVMQATPSTWRMLVDADWRGGPGFKALCGGEPLGADLARELGARTGSLWNMYGPTETTVWSTLSAVTRGAPSIDIGVPIANTSVWILDARGGLCPVGVPGEIAIGGDGVSLGYLHRPELTADRFIADPFSVPPNALMYRTGDRGRWRADGRLEHLGRLDHQVKVRGFRIEPGEVEAALLADPGLVRCVVIAREDRPGDVRLVAYLVARDAQPLDEAAIRSRLKQTLPDYMLPQHFVGLPAIPLLPNGKVDRHALPVPSAKSTVVRRHVPPRTGSEQVVASAMEAALSLPELGAEDNFFALGGHSLLAAQFAASLASTTGLHVPMSAVFEAPTIAELAAWIDASSQNPGPAASFAATARADGDAGEPPANGDANTAPASLMQQRIWFLEQLRPGTSTHNTPSAHRLSGPLDVAVLERAFNAVIERQAVLRTALVRRDLDLVQQIAPALTVSLQPVHDLGAVEPGRREAELLELLQARASEPISTDTAPLFRVAMYRLAPEEHVLFFMPHHLIWDGWSFDIFYTEMAALYAAFTHGVEPRLPVLTWRYGDFSRWQKQWLEGSDAKRQLTYWSERFAALPEPLALPLDKPRPAQMSGAGETQPIAWPASLVEQARAFGAARGATLFMTLLAMFALLLHRTTGQRDIVVGSPFRGRHRPQDERVMGFFVNALPLRLTVDADHNFAELLAQVRIVVLEAFAAPDVPIERLVQALKLPRDESRTPLYQAFFSFQDARDRQRDWGPLRQTQLHVFQKGAAEDLGVWLLDHGDGLAGGLTFATDLLLPVTAARTIQRLEQLAKAALGEPERALRELGSLEPAVRASLAPPARRLPDAAPQPAIIEPLMSDAQQRVAALWQEVLGTSGIGPTDNFFDLGGHSLLAMRVVSQMQSRLGLVVPLRRLIYESLAQIAVTPFTPIDTAAAPAEAPAGGLLSRVFGRFGRRT